MRCEKTLVIVLVLLLLPLTVAGQSVDELVERGKQAGMDAELLANLERRSAGAGLSVAETAQLIEPAVQLAEQELPATAVVQRALEGLARRVPHDRIVEVLGRLQDATERAGATGESWLARADVQAMFGEGVSPGESQARTAILEGLAQAYTRDVPAEALESALNRIPSHVEPGRTSPTAVGAALQVLADLSISSREPELAAGLLSQALNSGFAARDLRRLPGALEAAERRGDLPAEAAARGALAEMAMGTPAANVLENLFQGQIPGQPPGGTPPGLDRRPGAEPPGGPPQRPPTTEPPNVVN